MNTFVRGLLQLIPRNLVKPVVSCIRVINSCRIHERLNGSEALVIHISSQGGSISPEGVANEDASAFPHPGGALHTSYMQSPDPLTFHDGGRRGGLGDARGRKTLS